MSERFRRARAAPRCVRVSRAPLAARPHGRQVGELAPPPASLGHACPSGRSWAGAHGRSWARACGEAGDDEGARAVYQRVINAEAIGSRGQAYQAMGRYDEALADLNRAIELDPSYRPPQGPGPASG